MKKRFFGLTLASLLAVSFAPAQQMSPRPSQIAAAQKEQAAQSTESDDANREERIKQHEDRVRQIIERRRQERQGAVPVDPSAPVPVAVPPAEQSETTKSAISLGNILYYVVFRIPDKKEEVQLDTVVRAGDRFVSEVRLHNEVGTPYDRVRLALRYDKRFLKPVRLFDSALRGAADPDPKFDIIERDSIISYDLKLDQPRISKEVPVLKIVWEALRPTEHTGLNFTFARDATSDEPSTGIYSEGRNILGNPDDPIDGVLGGSVLVLKPFDPTNSNPEILQGKKEELRKLALGTVASQARVGLRLVGPKEPPPLGEDFFVEVQLDNPSGAIIDTLQFFVEFDPGVLEAIDDDRGNLIKRGVNVLDGPYRKFFPFDFHRRNDVDNNRGYINYAMGLSEGLSLPSATLARIRFRPKTMTAVPTNIELIAGRPGLANRTTIKNFGFEVFTGDPALTTPLYATTIAPKPAPTPSPDETAAAAPLPSLLYAVATFPTRENVRQIPPRP